MIYACTHRWNYSQEEKVVYNIITKTKVFRSFQKLCFGANVLIFTTKSPIVKNAATFLYALQYH